MLKLSVWYCRSPRNFLLASTEHNIQTRLNLAMTQSKQSFEVMSQWTTVLLLTVVAPVLAENNGKMRIFVVNLNDYIRVIAEQAEVIAEYKNTTDALQKEVAENKNVSEALRKAVAECRNTTDALKEAAAENGHVASDLHTANASASTGEHR